jgi:predicted enzyme related to lactoylglutathione lyase
MSRIIHFEIQADDIERASKFYQNVLGWKLEQMMTKEKDGMDYWGITTGESGPGINGGLYRREDGDEDFRLFDCTALVEDIDKSVEELLKNGGQIIKAKSEIPHVGWFVTAKDTEGNRFGLMQPTEWQAK